MDSDTAGIVVAFVLLLALEPAVIYWNFAPRFKKPNRPESPSPERYFYAAVHSFIAMVVTGAILTRLEKGSGIFSGSACIQLMPPEAKEQRKGVGSLF